MIAGRCPYGIWRILWLLGSGAFAATLRPRLFFKIGLTRDPRWRFHDAPFAYAIDDEYDSMEVDHCRLAAKDPEERIG